MKNSFVSQLFLSIIFLATVSSIFPGNPFACETHHFGSSSTPIEIFSDGEIWEFTAKQSISQVVFVETLSNIASAGNNTLNINISLNGAPVSSWSEDNVASNSTEYIHKSSSSFKLTTGDTIRYMISGGTSTTPGGVISGVNYVKLCSAEPADTTLISGTIYNNDGSTPLIGVDGITVQLWDNDNIVNSLLQEASVSAVDGSYSFSSGLSAGAYKLRAVADGLIDEYWAGAESVYERSDAELINLAEGQQRTGIDFQLGQGSVVSGRLYQTDGISPINGEFVVDVCAHTDEGCGTVWDFCAHLENTSEYTLHLPPGNYFIETLSDKYIGEWWAHDGSKRDCQEAEQVTMPSGDSGDYDFQLEEGIQISGEVKTMALPHTVIQNNGQIRIGFVEGNPCNHGGDSYGGPISVETGTFSYGVAPGTYYIYAEAANYVDKWWTDGNGIYDCNNAQALTVTSGTPVDPLSFYLDEGNLITGTVYSGNRITPVTHKEYSVEIIKTSPCDYLYDQKLFLTTLNTTTGRYSVRVPDDSYYLSLNTGNYDSNLWWSDKTSVASSQCEKALLLQVSQDMGNINFYWPAFPWNLFIPILSNPK